MGLEVLTFQQIMSSQEYVTAASLGLLEGVTVDVKFGYAADISILGDIWADGIPYVYPVDAGQPVEILSDNVGDTSVLTVVVIDKVTGLERTEDVTLTGTAAVLVPGGDVIAVNRAFNNNGIAYLGIITIRGTGAPNANVFARVLVEDQQTAQTPYMVPSDKIALINNYSTAINKTGGVDVAAIMRLVITKQGGVPRTKIRYGLQRGGVSNLSSDLIVPIPVPPLAKVQVTADPSAVADISGEFSMVLINKGLIPADMLAAIING